MRSVRFINVEILIPVEDPAFAYMLLSKYIDEMGLQLTREVEWNSGDYEIVDENGEVIQDAKSTSFITL